VIVRLLAAIALIHGQGLHASAPQEPSKFVFEQVHFGNIPVELSLYADSAEQAAAASKAAFARVAELSVIMNDYAYEPPSPLNLVAARAPKPVKVPAELLRALRRSVEMHAITNGAFDVTAKPFVQLWRTSRRIGELPPEHRLQNARRYVNAKALVLDDDKSTAALKKQGMWLDLGGLAKGMIGDEIVSLLQKRGITRCRYRAGGDMVFGDAPPGQDGWRVTVPDLLIKTGDGKPQPLSFTAANSAASVSGDIYRYVEIDGMRYAHVIDPRSGLGVTDRRVTCVRGKRGIDTDPLATAGLILDEKAWRAALAQVPGCRGNLAKIKR
jgi:thiamine biosynthesis lipoprotein